MKQIPNENDFNSLEGVAHETMPVDLLDRQILAHIDQAEQMMQLLERPGDGKRQERHTEAFWRHHEEAQKAIERKEQSAQIILENSTVVHKTLDAYRQLVKESSRGVSEELLYQLPSNAAVLDEELMLAKKRKEIEEAIKLWRQKLSDLEKRFHSFTSTQILKTKESQSVGQDVPTPPVNTEYPDARVSADEVNDQGAREVNGRMQDVETRIKGEGIQTETLPEHAANQKNEKYEPVTVDISLDAAATVQEAVRQAALHEEVVKRTQYVDENERLVACQRAFEVAANGNPIALSSFFKARTWEADVNSQGDIQSLKPLPSQNEIFRVLIAESMMRSGKNSWDVISHIRDTDENRSASQEIGEMLKYIQSVESFFGITGKERYEVKKRIMDLATSIHM